MIPVLAPGPGRCPLTDRRFRDRLPAAADGCPGTLRRAHPVLRPVVEPGAGALDVDSPSDGRGQAQGEGTAAPISINCSNCASTRVDNLKSWEKHPRPNPRCYRRSARFGTLLNLSERLHTAEIAGSKPASPTQKICRFAGKMYIFLDSGERPTLRLRIPPLISSRSTPIMCLGRAHGNPAYHFGRTQPP